MVVAWEMNGQCIYMGNVWAMYGQCMGRCMGDVWAMYGLCMG